MIGIYLMFIITKHPSHWELGGQLMRRTEQEPTGCYWCSSNATECAGWRNGCADFRGTPHFIPAPSIRNTSAVLRQQQAVNASPECTSDAVKCCSATVPTACMLQHVWLWFPAPRKGSRTGYSALLWLTGWSNYSNKEVKKGGKTVHIQTGLQRRRDI